MVCRLGIRRSDVTRVTLTRIEQDIVDVEAADSWRGSSEERLCRVLHTVA